MAIAKIILSTSTCAIVLLILGLYLSWGSLKPLIYEQITSDMFVSVDSDVFDPGPALGSDFPGVIATYKGRELRLIAEFAGSNGTVFVATRSAQWCPYCMKQMIQLQEYKAVYDKAGIAIVAMTYDDPELQQAFVDQWGISYPIIHDVDTLSFKTLGILNRSYNPGDEAYGIPHPGTIIVNPDGKVVGKLFLEAYSVRVDALSTLIFAKQALGLSAE
ncbi:redoxin domain-containing protein [Halieaceae bacterium IMCC8485]|uniref:Redoxin domain-containing protein n=1 Tax=Candidatus Seongchinamella marina TaxID=2518990 RepID=A0ABT3ST65_9GAMM|nr:redoxin domain-containing protein [Candidatus Seongchinamella marina]